MTIIYLVGPSGSGKSALWNELLPLDDRFVHFSLDEEVKRRMPEFNLQRDGWHIRWNVCREALDELDQNADPDKIYLVDSGAGALSRQYGREYFIERAAQMICLNGNPRIIYESNAEKFRKKGEPPRPYDAFYAEEYSPKRQQVYDAAKLTIDTTAADQKTVLESLRASIESLLSKHEAKNNDSTD